MAQITGRTGRPLLRIAAGEPIALTATGLQASFFQCRFDMQGGRRSDFWTRALPGGYGHLSLGAHKNAQMVERG